MIEVAVNMMIQTFEIIVPLIVIVLALDFLGSFLFNKR